MSASRLQYYEAIMSHPKYGWMAVCIPATTYAEAVTEAEVVGRMRPGWVITLTGDHTQEPPPTSVGTI